MALDARTRQRLDELVTGHPVVLFMKGTPDAPRCGFSARVVAILDELLDEYVAVDVLPRPEIRDGIKEYSEWPTIPQLYVHGEFVGGCDIVQEMARSDELERVLGVKRRQVAPPIITISDTAAEVLRKAAGELDGTVIRLTISRQFVADLAVVVPDPTDLQISSNGVTLSVERRSATRADGIRIDLIRSGLSAGFTIDNPNAPG